MAMTGKALQRPAWMVEDEQDSMLDRLSAEPGDGDLVMGF